MGNATTTIVGRSCLLTGVPDVSVTGEILAFVLLILGVVTGASALAYKIYKIAKRLEGSVGVDSQGRTLSERMSRVEHQLWPNGGDSLADQVRDIDSCARDTSVEVRLIRDLLVSIVEGRGKA